MMDEWKPSAAVTVAVWIAALVIPVTTLPAVLIVTFIILLFGWDSPYTGTRKVVESLMAPGAIWIAISASAVAAVVLWSERRRRLALICIAMEWALVLACGFVLLT